MKALALSGFVAGLGLLAASAAVTAGWENISPGRAPFPASKILWAADCSQPTNFVWEAREGAVGSVEVTPAGIRILKLNDRGYIVVKGQPFAVTKGQRVRCFADQETTDADVDFSSGAMRGHGRVENLRIDTQTERKNFWCGGLQTMRGFPCTAPGMSYRKYGDYKCVDDVFTPAIVVSGRRSTSLWKNWSVEDIVAAEELWKKVIDRPTDSYAKDRIPEQELDRLLAADSVHTVVVKRVDGVSRLVADGEIIAPAVYHSTHSVNDPKEPKKWRTKTFAGRPLDGSAVKLMVKPLTPIHYTDLDGKSTDYWGLVHDLKLAMCAAPNSLFVVGISCDAPKDFIQKHHPEEAWLNEKGEPVYGTHGSCILGYLNSTKEQWAKHAFIWPSYCSRVWKEWVKERIRCIVAEIKRQKLDKRVVGVHVFGYHDGQFSVPFLDHSKSAQEEYARMIAEPDCLSTNYVFCMKQTGFRAQEEFVREFKKALGKPSVGVMWCESPFMAGRTTSFDLTSFTRSDAMDVIVCQPDYRERQPGFPTVSVVPLDSFHLHGKMFWNEYDYRTYAPVTTSGSGTSPTSFMSLGTAADIEMWRTMYRKVAGEADATRMGYWLYDMRSGWFYPPEIAADIRELAAEELMLARRKPSAWRPDVAFVVDEVQCLHEGGDAFSASTAIDDFTYSYSCRMWGTSGVPYERYLAEDVLTKPELLADKKVVVLAFFRRIDARRAALLKRLAEQGTTLVYLSQTGTRGGAEVTRFKPRLVTGKVTSQEVVPEPGVKENVINLLDHYVQRDGNVHSWLQPHCTVEEEPGQIVLARYAGNKAPAVVERKDADCLRVYVAAAGSLTPDLLNRFARESGAYAAVDSAGLQVNMNGDFMSIHCLRPGRYAIRLPFEAKVKNLKSGAAEKVIGRKFDVELTAGETCRFLLEK